MSVQLTFTFYLIVLLYLCRCSPSNPAQMTSAGSNAATKKIRTEYMKKFREPKWETLSKCYQDSVKYRLGRRLMEHTHRPLFGDGWDSGSDSSGRSSPRVRGVVESSNLHPHLHPSSSESTETPQVNTEQDTDTAGHNSLPVGRYLNPSSPGERNIST